MRRVRASAAFRAFGEAHRDRHESCVGCRLRRGGQVERIGRSAAICLACPGVRTPMVGWAPRAKPTRRPACSSTGPRLRRYGQVSAQQGRVPLNRPLRAPVNLKPMHHAFRGDGGQTTAIVRDFATYSPGPTVAGRFPPDATGQPSTSSSPEHGLMRRLFSLVVAGPGFDPG
jgi:hypothetical protein